MFLALNCNVLQLHVQLRVPAFANIKLSQRRNGQCDVKNANEQVQDSMWCVDLIILTD